MVVPRDGLQQAAAAVEKNSPTEKEDDVRIVNGNVVFPESRVITLKVIKKDLADVCFRVKYGSSLGKLKKMYAHHVQHLASCLRFLFDGRRITDEDTPKCLNMDDAEVIEVYDD